MQIKLVFAEPQFMEQLTRSCQARSVLAFMSCIESMRFGRKLEGQLKEVKVIRSSMLESKC